MSFSYPVQVSFFDNGGPCFIILCSVAVSHHFDADPDPACFFGADPDSACHFDAYSYPDPTFYLDADLDPSLQIQVQDLEKVFK